MRKITFLMLFLTASLTFAQQKIATTEDGEKVILKTDNTWEYVKSTSNENKSCAPKSDFKEPRWISSKIRTRNKQANQIDTEQY